MLLEQVKEFEAVIETALNGQIAVDLIKASSTIEQAFDFILLDL